MFETVASIVNHQLEIKHEREVDSRLRAVGVATSFAEQLINLSQDSITVFYFAVKQAVSLRLNAVTKVIWFQMCYESSSSLIFKAPSRALGRNDVPSPPIIVLCNCVCHSIYETHLT